MKTIKLTLLLFVGLGALALSSATAQRRASKSRLAVFRDNNCVSCHSNITEPLRMSAHYFEWLGSSHEKNNIACEQCHGGDPAATTARGGHQGVFRAAFPQSTLHPKNLPETCSKCHIELVAAFTKSQHFQMLWDNSSAPSCTTCHQHMATTVIYWPPQTAELCAVCHKEPTNRASQYPDVPAQASDSIAALSRADEVIEWSYFLIAEGQKRRLRFAPEVAELKRLQASLKQVKTEWHGFNLTDSRRKADQIFMDASKVKNALVKRVP